MSSLIQLVALFMTLVVYANANFKPPANPVSLSEIMREQSLEKVTNTPTMITQPKLSSWSKVLMSPSASPSSSSQGSPRSRSPSLSPNGSSQGSPWSRIRPSSLSGSSQGSTGSRSPSSSPPSSPNRSKAAPRMRSSSPSSSLKSSSSSNGSSGSSSSKLACSNSNYDFDYLRLAITWGPGYCATADRKCFKDHVSGFNIHGMWPSNQYGDATFCCFEKSLSSTQIDPKIWTDLTKSWHSHHHADINYGTWEHVSHQWGKHGTCLKDAPLFKGPNNYFKNSIAIYNGLNLLETLEKNKIVPNSTKPYQGQNIVSALKNSSNGKEVTLKCTKDPKTGKYVLVEIVVCVDENKNFVHCPRSRSKCLGDIMFMAK